MPKVLFENELHKKKGFFLHFLKKNMYKSKMMQKKYSFQTYLMLSDNYNHHRMKRLKACYFINFSIERYNTNVQEVKICI